MRIFMQYTLCSFLRLSLICTKLHHFYSILCTTLLCNVYRKKLYLCANMQMTFALLLWYNNNVRLYIIPRTMPFFVSLRPPRRENWDALKVAHGLSHCGVPYPLPKDSTVKMASGAGNRMYANATASKCPTYYGTRIAANGYQIFTEETRRSAGLMWRLSFQADSNHLLGNRTPIKPTERQRL